MANHPTLAAVLCARYDVGMLDRLVEQVRRLVPSGSCTEYALTAQECIGGEVWGYWTEDNPSAELGRDEGGHDFLVWGGWIVDVWASEYWSKPAYLREDDLRVHALYGDRAKWTRWKYEGVEREGVEGLHT